MARLWSSGFELNSTVNFGEWISSGNNTKKGTIQSSIVRSGSFALQASGATSGQSLGPVQSITASNSGGTFFFRFYLYVTTAPSAANAVAVLTSNLGAAASSVGIKLTSTSTLQLFNGTTQVGSDSSALTSNTWYRVEIKYDSTGGVAASTLEAELNGSVFATSATLTLPTIQNVSVGANVYSEAQTLGTWYFDDIAVNDSTGSFQNSYPGNGAIVHLRPNSISSGISSFSTQTGGDTGGGSNFTRINEVTFDDATTFNGANSINAEDLYAVDNCQISGAVNLVSVGFRFANNVADATTAIKLEIKKIVNGTTSLSAAIIPNTTTWNTNGKSTPQLYALTSYQDPDNNNWVQDTLNSMVIGYIISAGSTNRIQVSTLWALVEVAGSITTASGTDLKINEPGNIGGRISVGNGMSRSEVAN